jgi:hypothetical protein
MQQTFKPNAQTIFASRGLQPVPAREALQLRKRLYLDKYKSQQLTRMVWVFAFVNPDNFVFDPQSLCEQI